MPVRQGAPPSNEGDVGNDAPGHEVSGRMVLMVDDDPDVRTSVSRGLRHSGFDVRVAASGKEALRLLSNETHDALVLDVQMPELDGVAVVTALRALGNDIPICVLSARDTVNDRIAGLEAGADDYLTKPFDLGELVARLHALLRRSSHSDQQSDTMTVGPLTIDTARRLVFVDGERAELTKREFDLLAVLAENNGVVLSRQRLLELVWGYDFDVDTNVADVFISYLRRKLEREGHPRVIHTVRGIGYVLRDDP
ncbi:DNA-binding response OmpR family regulator [Mycobacterium sp. AZCC_0083]|nr:DNA-binding response OmpR family regulator [Mycobacterium sp. AZCC_0083]